jgi:hypothetical protein
MGDVVVERILSAYFLLSTTVFIDVDDETGEEEI